MFLVRQLGHGDVAAVEVLQSIFSDRLQDFVLSINESDIAVVKQISPSTTSEDLLRLAQSMEDLLKTELFIKTVIGIGTVSSHLRGAGGLSTRRPRLPLMWVRSLIQRRPSSTTKIWGLAG